jgi:hypothetical protein
MVGRCILCRPPRHEEPYRQCHVAMLLGTGAAYSASKKQKLNTKSSTESELVGIDDMIPQVLWTKYFMEAQG